jgi:hypothetical protein
MESKVKMNPVFFVLYHFFKSKNQGSYNYIVLINLNHNNEIINTSTAFDCHRQDKNVIGIWKLKKLKQDAKPNTEILPKKQHNFR